LSDSDPPYSLRQKIQHVQGKIARLAQGAKERDMLPQDQGKLEQYAADLARALHSTEADLEAGLGALLAQEKALEQLTRQWKDEITKSGSYGQVYARLKIAQDQALNDKSGHLRKYADKAAEIQPRIKSMRQQDLGEYQDIDREIRECKFRSADACIRKYANSQEHRRVMVPELAQYLESFRVNVTATTYLSVLEDQDFDGSGLPDFQITATWDNVRQVFRKDDIRIKSEIVMGSLVRSATWKMLESAPSMTLHIVEVDAMFNDDFGNCTMDANPLFRNESIQKEHVCGNQGKISLRIVPAFELSAKLPAFSE
jgi:hypothetical protein